MNALADQIKKGRKFEQVLEGARCIFMQDGFEGASVDDIAKAACVSKATLYSYFPDKRLLFLEVVSGECSQQSAAALNEIDLDAPAEEVLLTAARHLVAFATSTLGQSIFRICVAESDRFPELGRLFYESGPKRICGKLSVFLKRAVDRGELRIDDIGLAANQFMELCKADLFAQLMFGVRHGFDEDEVAHVTRAQ